MKYLKYFEADISWQDAVALSNKTLENKLKSINSFGRYIGKYNPNSNTPDSNNKLEVTSDLTSKWMSRLRKLYRIKGSTLWVSEKRILEFLQQPKEIIAAKMSIIDSLYKDSITPRHDMSKIADIKDLFFTLQDEEVMGKIEIIPTYQDTPDGLIACFFVSDIKSRVADFFGVEGIVTPTVTHADRRGVSDQKQSQFDLLFNKVKQKLPHYGLRFMNKKDGIIRLEQVR